jgi:hypothetical protein
MPSIPDMGGRWTILMRNTSVTADDGKSPAMLVPR